MTHVRWQEEYTYHISTFDVLKGSHELVEQIYIRDDKLLLAPEVYSNNMKRANHGAILFRSSIFYSSRLNIAEARGNLWTGMKGYN